MKHIMRRPAPSTRSRALRVAALFITAALNSSIASAQVKITLAERPAAVQGEAATLPSGALNIPPVGATLATPDTALLAAVTAPASEAAERFVYPETMYTPIPNGDSVQASAPKGYFAERSELLALQSAGARFDGSMNARNHFIVTNAVDWRQLWRRIGDEAPAVNFRTHVAAVVIGGQPGDHRIEFANPVELREQFIVLYKILPSQKPTTTTVIRPYAIQLFRRRKKTFRLEESADDATGIPLPPLPMVP